MWAQSAFTLFLNQRPPNNNYDPQNLHKRHQHINKSIPQNGKRPAIINIHMISFEVQIDTKSIIQQPLPQ